MVAVLINRTKTGKSIRAVAQNRPAAVLMGVNVNRFNYLKRKLTDKVGALKTEMESLNAASTKPRRFTAGA